MARCIRDEVLTEENLIRIGGWAKDGLTDEQIAKNLDIAPKTLREWKKVNSSLCAILKRSKDIADREVENALFKSALGYDVEEEYCEKSLIDGELRVTAKKTTRKHIAPNVTSIIFWLKNRKKLEWRDKIEQAVSVEDTSKDVLKEYLEGAKNGKLANTIKATTQD